MRAVLIGFINAYQYLISPILGDNCRFYPSCSTYAMEAIKRHGVFIGFFLSARRLLKCHPFHEGGIDPVPEQFGKK